MATDDQPTARKEISHRRNHSERKYHWVDRPPDDHFRQPQQGTRGTIPGVHDRGENAEGSVRRDRIYTCEWNGRPIDVSRAKESAASGRRRELPKAHLFLAERPSAR